MNLSLAMPFFLTTLISGSILSISSLSWFSAWIGLELNLMSFIPLLTIKMNPYSSEASIKYFLIQALGSTVIIMSSAMLLSLPNQLPYFLILFALLLKLGAAPFHLWFPQVMEGLTWPQSIILLTVQKLAPMFLISLLMDSWIMKQVLIFAAILSAIVGALGGLNNMKLRKIMAFSSINHMSWMLIAISMNHMLWILYFSFYFFISSSVIMMFYYMKAFTMSNIMNISNFNPLYKLMFPMSLLSLGGLPPFSGFIPKWLMVQMMVAENLFIPLFFMLSSALITLYYYLRIIIPFILLFNPMLTFRKKTLPYSSISFTTIFSLNSLGMCLPLFFTLQ
uniref:NADH dehydrogenase subunit 2 n=1 Tax=Eucrate crenata TaxID=486106 RepID=UPI0021CCE5FC|nr:NADH dehydrogenase subunit 2 [Eucrate crenata]UWM93450.1 NADH dehydrogenase subunit 2 [Eucrate crenata]WAK85098.1 NADH dehydrogenase subunit 2 [Eucrate crenata]